MAPPDQRVKCTLAGAGSTSGEPAVQAPNTTLPHSQSREANSESHVLQVGGKSRFTVVCTENTTINNNTTINSVLHTHNYKPTFAPSCIIVPYPTALLG